MTTFNAGGICGNPTILANEQGEFVILENIRDMSTVESYARALTIKMGGVVFLASYVMTVTTAKKVAVPGTLTYALNLGEKILAAEKIKIPYCKLPANHLKPAFTNTAEPLFQEKLSIVPARTNQDLPMAKPS